MSAKKLMRKSLALQQTLGLVFDITFDCGGGAVTDQERAHAELTAAFINSGDDRFNRIGVRIYDPNHDARIQDVGILVGPAGRCLAHVTVPKVRDVVKAVRVTDRINQAAKAADTARHLSIHVLIETHGALARVFDTASLVQVECLNFGLMDFVSVHNDAVPGTAMGSPEQFEHPLIRRALADISAACHVHGKVPSRNASTDIKHSDRAGANATRTHNELDYLHKWGIHPDQIAPIVSVLRLSHEEVTRVSAISTPAQDAAWRSIQHEGRLYNHASHRYWWAVLQRAHTTGMKIPSNAIACFSA